MIKFSLNLKFCGAFLAIVFGLLMYSSAFAVAGLGIHFIWSSSQYADNNDEDSLVSDLGNPFTAEAWFNADSLYSHDTQSHTLFADAGINAVGGCTFYVGIGGADKLYFFMIDSTSNIQYMVSDYAIETGLWYHVAVDWNGTTGRMWLNGDLQAGTISGFTPKYNSYDAFAVGTQLIETGGLHSYQPFDGVVDEVRFSDSIRYTGEFTPSVYEFSTDEHTMALYHFNANTLDSSGNGYDLTPSGNPTYTEGYVAGACVDLLDYISCRAYGSCEWDLAYPPHCQLKTPAACGDSRNTCSECLTEEQCTTTGADYCAWDSVGSSCENRDLVCGTGSRAYFCRDQTTCEAASAFWGADDKCYPTLAEMTLENSSGTQQLMYEWFYQVRAHFDKAPFNYFSKFFDWFGGITPNESAVLSVPLNFSNAFPALTTTIDAIDMTYVENMTINFAGSSHPLPDIFHLIVNLFLIISLIGFVRWFTDWLF